MEKDVKMRKVDVEKLTDEQAEKLMQKLSKELDVITSRAAEDANKLLNRYGLKVKIGIVIDKSK